MNPWVTEREAQKELFRHEMQTLSLYGYGAKGFTLATIASAISISNGQVGGDVIEKLIDIGKSLINAPMELLDNVDDVLAQLHQDYKLIVATKGDLLDQERKLQNSNLEQYFHHVEIMSDKNPASYRKLIRHLDIQPQEFLMIGNSLKSDVIPVLDIGEELAFTVEDFLDTPGRSYDIASDGSLLHMLKRSEPASLTGCMWFITGTD